MKHGSENPRMAHHSAKTAHRQPPPEVIPHPAATMPIAMPPTVPAAPPLAHAGAPTPQPPMPGMA